jgi:hypothetical protein
LKEADFKNRKLKEVVLYIRTRSYAGGHDEVFPKLRERQSSETGSSRHHGRMFAQPLYNF